MRWFTPPAGTRIYAGVDLHARSCSSSSSTPTARLSSPRTCPRRRSPSSVLSPPSAPGCWSPARACTAGTGWPTPAANKPRRSREGEVLSLDSESLMRVRLDVPAASARPRSIEGRATQPQPRPRRVHFGRLGNAPSASHSNRATAITRSSFWAITHTRISFGSSSCTTSIVTDPRPFFERSRRLWNVPFVL